MTLADFHAIAANFPDPFRLLVKESVESTNDEVRALGQAGAADGLIILAEHQTAGRGRRGTSWFSHPGESLTFSILLRPQEPRILWPRLALATGLAVAEAIESTGVKAGIKWPNDVWIHGKKVAGILVEMGLDFAILGIGLNVKTTTFPPGVAEIATSVQFETRQEVTLSQMLGVMIARLAVRRQQIGHDFSEVLRGVQERCVLTGKEVSLKIAGELKQGYVEGLSPEGELLLKSGGETQKVIQADEVRILPG